MPLTDDAGKPISLDRAALPRLAAVSVRDALACTLRSPLHAVIRTFVFTGKVCFAGLFPLGLILAALFIAAALLVAAEGVAGLWILVFSPVAVTAIFAIMLVVGGLGHALTAAREAAAAQMLADKLCPCCAYSLAAIPSSSGPLTICPECASSWVATRIGQPRQQQTPRVVVMAPDSPTTGPLP